MWYVEDEEVIDIMLQGNNDCKQQKDCRCRRDVEDRYEFTIM